MTVVVPKGSIAGVPSFGHVLLLVAAGIAALFGVARLWEFGQQLSRVDFYRYGRWDRS